MARHLQTRRLIAGDSLALDQDQNFYCVVEGLVQVYAPTGQRPDDAQENDVWTEEEMNGYQLLNEVGSGGTLSSLFTILTLFTENVKLSWKADEDGSPDATESHESIRRRSNSDISQLDLRSPEAMSPQELGSPISFTAGNKRPVDITSPMMGAYPETPRTATARSQATTPGTEYPFPRQPPPLRRPTMASQVRRGVVARATQDSTLAVIPAEAFKRLTKKHPKASAHIVQGKPCPSHPPNHRIDKPLLSHSDSLLSCHLQRGSQVPRPHHRSPSNGEVHQ